MKCTRSSVVVTQHTKPQYGRLDPATGQWVALSDGRQWLLDSFDAMDRKDVELILPFLFALSKVPRPASFDAPGTPQRLPAKAQERGWAIVK